MPVMITDLNAFEKLQAVEGPSYADNGSAYSFSAYRSHWLACYAPYQEHITPDTTVDVDGGDGAIYGREGYTRYAVKGNGEIVFLSSAARPDQVARAREAGFTIGG